MIKSIELKNIQSHENTFLEFDKGINCIVGSSNNGKTAILRGLYWVRYNRPLGIDTLASHWNLTEKGDLKNEMSVTVKTEEGIVTRKRTKSLNQYSYGAVIDNVVKSDVPNKVLRTLKLSETNIQKQLDSPFLLSETSGEVAKYFNKVVRLDVIDKVLTNAESLRRKINQDIELVIAAVAVKEKKLEEFSWLDSVEKYFIKYDSVKNKFDSLSVQLLEFEKDFEKYQIICKRSEFFASVQEFSQLIEEIQLVENKKITLLQQGKNLSNEIANYKELSAKNWDFSKQKQLLEKIGTTSDTAGNLNYVIKNFSKEIENYKNASSQSYDFSKQKQLLKKWETVFEEVEKIAASLEKLNNSFSSYKEFSSEVENIEERIIEYKKQLPKICPLCGAPLNDEGKCLLEEN